MTERMTICEARVALDSGKMSACELTNLFLDAIEEHDGAIRSYLHVNKYALKQADEAQKKIVAGDVTLLTGIPIALKDNLCTTDMPTTCASKMLEGYVSPYDATVVARLRSAGAVLLGKLNMDEFAMGASTVTSYFGRTNNPVNADHVPGGSSGGSAAAVAAGLCVASLGSDTGGSVRQPASFCGVTGIRPTYGRVPRYGVVSFASSLDQVGPIGNSPADCAAVLSVIEGRCPHDQTSLDAPPGSPRNIDVNLRGMKIGVIAELMGAGIDVEVSAAVNNAAQYFKEQGATVETASLPMLAHGVPAYYLISSCEAAANLARFDGIRYGFRASGDNYKDIVERSRDEGFGREVKRRILLGNYALSSGYYDDYYLRAVRLANVVKAQYNDAFSRYDALLSPVSPTTAWRWDEAPTDPAQVYLADICTVSAPLAGLPAVSVPCGADKKGLPIGLMITTPRWADYTALGIAQRWWER